MCRCFAVGVAVVVNVVVVFIDVITVVIHVVFTVIVVVDVVFTVIVVTVVVNVVVVLAADVAVVSGVGHFFSLTGRRLLFSLFLLFFLFSTQISLY